MLRLISVVWTAASVLTAFSGPARADIYGAVLPSSRAVQVGHVVTAFATILNANASTATNCGLSAPSNFQGTFSFQTTNPTTNQLTGSANTRVSIAAGAAQTYVFAMTPSSTFAQTDFQLGMTCTGFSVVPITGVNTFLLTSSASPTADIVTVAATVSNDGIARTPGTTATGVFSVAAINIGVAATVTVSVDTGNTPVNASFGLCRTNAQGQCTTPSTPAASVQTTLANNETGFFSVFLTSQGTVIPLDPARFRAFVRYRVAGNSVGATSVAVQTQTMLADGGGNLQLGSVGISAAAGSILNGTNFAAAAGPQPGPLPAGIQPLNSTYNISLTNASGAPNNGLEAPVKVTVPYAGLGVSDPNSLVVAHYDSAAGTYSPVTIHDINTANQTITFDSRQFSAFTLGMLAFVSPNASSVPNFAPNVNGFRITNNHNQYLTPGGNCIGMSSFALWYYLNRPAQQLYGKYPITNQPASIEDLIAVRAQITQAQYWSNLYTSTNELVWQRSHPMSVRNALRAYISLWQKPVVLVVGTPASPTQHAVLAYGYDQNNFFIYDNEHPAQVKLLPHNAAGFGTYDGTYTLFSYIGATSFGGGDGYANLAVEADGGFLSSQNITITSPTQGQSVSSTSVQLTGSLSANLNASMARYWKNGLPNFTPFTTSGSSFNQPIVPSAGLNTVVVLAGTPVGGSLSNTLANAAAKIVTFNGPPAVKFRSTLVWNQGDTDVDQYVTEPTGATSWYSSKTTSAGLTLDIDNTQGGGLPENTTISATSTPIAGIYRVRLHYYSDHSTQQTVSGSVVLQINERQPNQPASAGPTPRLWSLTISNPSNAAPGSTGADWINIADVDVINKTITLR